MSDDLLRLFGEQVRTHRNTRGITQEALAGLTGLHRTYIGGIETGKRNPSLVNIGKIAKALGVPPEQLIGENRIEDNSATDGEDAASSR